MQVCKFMRSVIRRIKRIIVNMLLLAFGIPVVLVVFLKFFNPPTWGWLVSRSLFPPQGYPEQVQHQWVSISSISSSLPKAIIASEDQRFLSHWGVDIDSLLSVIKSRGQHGPARGASTITQQTAKNVFLFPSHTYVRKAYELYIALLIELIWGKERIMEMYLNVVEFGPGIYGAQAASKHYFGISASHLTPYQAAQLAVVLPNPYKIHPYPMTEYVQQRVYWVLRQMQYLGAIPF